MNFQEVIKMVDCSKCTIRDGCALAGDNYKKELCEKYTEEKYEYHYYVTYFYQNNKGQTGYGYSDVYRTEKLSTMGEILNLKKYLEEVNNLKGMIILDYKELEVS